jgi:hypothetical protein
MHVREVDHRAHPAGPAADLDAVLERAEVADAAHHLDPEGGAAVLPEEPLAHECELLDDGVDRVLSAAAEEEARVEDDDLRAARRGDPGAPVERAEGRRPLAAARLEVADPAEERRVHRQRDVVLSRQLAEALGPGVVHPEPRLEVDLARVVPALEQELDRRLRTLPVGDVRGAEANASHGPTVRHSSRPVPSVRWGPYARCMEQPTRIDLLELDIDLRLTELWREAADVSEWNLEVVSAFMRAAYGKGYCDALTEDAPGSLCLEHGYDVPRRRDRDAARG